MRVNGTDESVPFTPIRVNDTLRKELSKAMRDITSAIKDVKSRVSLQEWQERIMECRQSGMSVEAWCKSNGISASTYYRSLRRIRENVLEENKIIPVEAPPAAPLPSAEIRIESNGIAVTLPGSASPEQLTAILCALKSC